MVYGILKADPVIIEVNDTGTAFNTVMLYMKVAYMTKSAKLA